MPHFEMRRSRSVSGEALIRAAEIDLKPLQPQLYLALVLCLFGGLRKREADLLTWDQVDGINGQIRVERTKYFTPKTEESTRAIDMPPVVMSELAALRRPRRRFVLEGSAPRFEMTYNWYRAEPTWRALGVWLRAQGVVDRKAVHSLRKECGSFVAGRYGIEAARAHLGHSDIAVTSAFYVTKRSRVEADFAVSPANQLQASGS